MTRDRALVMRRLAASFFSRWETDPMSDWNNASHCLNEAVDAIDGLHRWPSTKPEFQSELDRIHARWNEAPKAKAR